eukprot:592_1
MPKLELVNETTTNTINSYELIKNELAHLNITLFWQYPGITEKTFYEQNKNNKNYIGFPWATVIDKKLNLDLIYVHIKKQLKNNTDNNNLYTCCQHISFRQLISFWKRIGIQTVYTPHKILNENEINGLKIIPCPLYAINIEDSNRNELIKKTDVIHCERPILYSFVGAYRKKYYLSNIRKRIFHLPTKNKQDVVIKNTGRIWHFECIVYGRGCHVNQTKLDKKDAYEYNKILLESKYTLAPSGTGPNSFRFWEALGAGSIPVLLSDTLQLPNHKLWDKAIIRIKENIVDQIDAILRNVSVTKEKEYRKNCLKIYYSFQNNYINL